jgi:hypothetical protein
MTPITKIWSIVVKKDHHPEINKQIYQTFMKLS